MVGLHYEWRAETTMNITNQLRQLVTDHGNDSDLSRLSGLPQPLIQKFRTDPDRGIMLDTAEAMAEALGHDVTIAEILVKEKK